MTRQYPVIYEWAGENFAGYAPDVSGCMATAKTLPLMRTALKGALETHPRWMEDDGDPIPAPSDSVIVDMEPDKEFPQPRGYYVIVERLILNMPKSRTSKDRSLHPPEVKRAVTRRRVMQAA